MHTGILAKLQPLRPIALVAKALCVLFLASPENLSAYPLSNQFLNSSANTDNAFDRLASPPAHDAAGHWTCVWEAESTTGGSSLLFSRSSDNTINWTPQAPLFAGSSTELSTNTQPMATIDISGTWLCIWSSNDTLNNTTGTDFDILLSRSTDQGANWSAPAPLTNGATTDSADDRSPWLACNNQGRWIALWTVNTPVGSRLRQSTSSDGGLTWSEPQPLLGDSLPDGTSQLRPRIVTDAKGVWVATWISTSLSGSTFKAEVARSTDNGQNWTYIAALNSSAANAIPVGHGPEVEIATDASGRWLACWDAPQSSGSETTLIYTSVSQDNATTWSAPATLSPAGSFEQKPRPYISPDGTWVIGCIGFMDGYVYDYYIAGYYLSADQGASWQFKGFFSEELGETFPPPLLESAPYLFRLNSSDWAAFYDTRLLGCMNGPNAWDSDVRLARKTTSPPISTAASDWMLFH